MQLLKGSTLTVKGGTIEGNPEATPPTKMVIQNYSNLTLDGVTVVGKEYDTYVLSNNYGEIHLKNGTTITPSGDHIAMDLWYGMAAVYDDPGVTVYIDTPDVQINGPIEFGHPSRIKDEEQFLQRCHLYVCADYPKAKLDALDIRNSTPGSTTQYEFVLNEDIGYYELVPIVIEDDGDGI